NVISAGDDHHVVPAIKLEQVLKTGIVDQTAGDPFLPVFFPHRLLPNETESTALASFVIDESGNIRQRLLVADLVLISADDPFVRNRIVGNVLRAVLNTGVVRRVTAERKPQVEILRHTLFPDDKRIPFGGILDSRFSVDRTVLDRP